MEHKNQISPALPAPNRSNRRCPEIPLEGSCSVSGASDFEAIFRACTPGFRKVVTPLVLFTRGLEEMTNAALQRDRQG